MTALIGVARKTNFTEADIEAIVMDERCKRFPRDSQWCFRHNTSWKLTDPQCQLRPESADLVEYLLGREAS